jgi:flagellar biosynthesis protein FlhF
MQVKKFEARSMKEALDLVKTQLGPDAIILSARDNSKGFGLGGYGSVEITAAVSEETLQKKKFVEAKIREQDRERIQKAPAKVQKNFIESMVSRYTNEKNPPRTTSRPYIDIQDDGQEDDERPMELGRGSAGSSAAQALRENSAAEERIKSAAQRAWNALALESEARTQAQAATQRQDKVQSDSELKSLKDELAQLKSTLSQFQKIPQTMVPTSAPVFPGSDYGLTYEMSAMFEKLGAAGLAQEIVGELLVKAQAEMPPIRFKNKALIEGWVAKYILDTTKIVGDLQGQRVQMFVGPAGSGKTSTLVKLASHYVVNGNKKVALLSTDTMKVGGSDQMRIYAQILNVPFAVIRSKADWSYVMKQLSGYDYILCDAPGLALKTLEEIQQLKALMPEATTPASIHLVLNSTSKDQDLTESGRRYKSVQFQDVIFTGLDNSVAHGSIYNFVHRFGCPLHSFGIGPHVPEDFELATRERVVDLIFKLSKVKKET